MIIDKAQEDPDPFSTRFIRVTIFVLQVHARHHVSSSSYLRRLFFKSYAGVAKSALLDQEVLLTGL